MTMAKARTKDLTFKQVCGVGVGVPWSRGFGPESESHLKETRLRSLSVSSGLLCNFVAVYLTSVQFIYN